MMKVITEVAKTAKIDEKYVDMYGKFKAKIDLSIMDELKDYHTKWIKSDRGRQMSYDIMCMWNLKKKWYKGIHLQNRNRLTDLENELMVTRHGRWG